MKNCMARGFRALCLITLLVPASACGLSGGVVEGRVLEEGTEKPVSGAIVVALWIGHLATFAHGRTICYHVLSTITDDQGRYRFPNWRKEITQDWQRNVREEQISVIAYKAGYVWSKNVAHAPERVYVKPFTGTREERLRELLRIRQATRCTESGDSVKNLYKLYKALYDEAKAIPRSEQEAQLAESLSDYDYVLEFDPNAPAKVRGR